MLVGIGAALAAAVVFGVAAIMQAVGARRVAPAAGLDPRMLLRLLRHPVFVAAVLLNVLGFLLHLVALRVLPLYLAQGGIAASLVVTAALAVRVFGDRLRTAEWVAVAAVFAGLALMTSASGPTGRDSAGAAFLLGLCVALVLVAAAGLVVSRSHRPLVPAALGTLAGLGFAVDSVAIRVLPGFTPLELVQSGATYVFLASAGLSFLLYSIGLQRGAVTAATAPMIVMQTAVPAAVGVLLLDDGVRAGLLPVAVIGLVLTAGGAARLARFQGGTPQVGRSPDSPAAGPAAG
jgi:drug/metabolite transporter (DMT)-like permease